MRRATKPGGIRHEGRRQHEGRRRAGRRLAVAACAAAAAGASAWGLAPLAAGAAATGTAPRYAVLRHGGRTELCVVVSTAGVPGVTTADRVACAPLSRELPER